MLIVGTIALVSRLLPEVLSVDEVAEDRLSYPLTYWNGLGIFVGIGLVLATYFASSEREPAVMRVIGAGAMPLLSATIYLTLSRGAIAATIAGLVVYLVVARPRGALAGLLAGGSGAALAVVATYDADLLISGRATSAAGVAQGEDAAVLVGVAVLIAVAARSVGLLLDRRLARVRPSPTARRAVRIGVAAAALSALAVALVAFDLGDRVERQYDRFVDGSTISSADDPRERLTDPGNNGRIEHWEVALDGFADEPLTGTGAGTYGITWARERSISLKVEDAHSLYAEILSELGIVGLLLIVAAVRAGAVRLRSRPPRPAPTPARRALRSRVGVGDPRGDRLGLGAPRRHRLALGARRTGACRPSRGLDPRRAREPHARGRGARLPCACGDARPDGVLAGAPERRGGRIRPRRLHAAIDASLESLKAIPSRPQPFEVLGYCDSRLGLHELAIGAMRSGAERDPENWELYYGLALVRANAGKDPRAAAREALRLNPRGALPRAAVQASPPRATPKNGRGGPKGPASRFASCSVANPSYSRVRLRRTAPVPASATPPTSSGIATKPVNGRLPLPPWAATCSAGCVSSPPPPWFCAGQVALPPSCPPMAVLGRRGAALVRCAGDGDRGARAAHHHAQDEDHRQSKSRLHEAPSEESGRDPAATNPSPDIPLDRVQLDRGQLGPCGPQAALECVCGRGHSCCRNGPSLPDTHEPTDS